MDTFEAGSKQTTHNLLANIRATKNWLSNAPKSWQQHEDAFLRDMGDTVDMEEEWTALEVIGDFTMWVVDQGLAE